MAAGSKPPATSGTSDKAFVDSNVLIYAHDVEAGRKREVARVLLRDLWLARAGVLSAQVLHEFYVNVTRKIRTPLPKSEARRVVRTYIAWCLQPETGDIDEAFRIEDEAGISLGRPDPRRRCPKRGHAGVVGGSQRRTDHFRRHRGQPVRPAGETAAGERRPAPR